MEAACTKVDGHSFADTYAKMPRDVQLRVQALMRRRFKVPSVEEFIGEVSPHLPPPRHIKPLTDLLEKARHKPIRALYSWPPRHAKTTTLLHGFAYWLAADPADTCAYFTYSDRQARSKSRVAFRMALDANIPIDPSSKDMSEWRTIHGGGLLAGGVAGGLTGQGVSGLFVIDDPYKNREQADSVLWREKVWEWFTEVVMTRLEAASVIIVHTRWHEDDLIGRLSKDSSWTYVNTPGIAEEDDVLGREVGEALWPERFDRPYLDEQKRQMGEWSFAALYQGRPQPRGSNLFTEPARFTLPKTPEEWRDFLTGKRLVIGVDPAASEKTYADYSVAVVIARDGLGPMARSWILKVIRKQCTIPVFVSDLRALQSYWKALLAVEAVGGFKAVPQMLKHVDPSLRIVEIRPTTDKFIRGQGFAAAWNAGEVLVPVGDEPELAWVDPYLQELLSISGVKDAHDDQFDASAHGWNALANVVPQKARGSRVSSGPFG